MNFFSERLIVDRFCRNAKVVRYSLSSISRSEKKSLRSCLKTLKINKTAGNRTPMSLIRRIRADQSNKNQRQSALIRVIGVLFLLTLRVFKQLLIKFGTTNETKISLNLLRLLAKSRRVRLKDAPDCW